MADDDYFILIEVEDLKYQLEVSDLEYCKISVPTLKFKHYEKELLTDETFIGLLIYDEALLTKSVLSKLGLMAWFTVNSHGNLTFVGLILGSCPSFL